MGLSKNWQTQYIRMFGETWTYRDALESKAWEGHIESGLQLILQTYLQHQILWPSMKSLRGEMTKAYYFNGTKPGNVSIFLGISFYFLPATKQLGLRLLLIFFQIPSPHLILVVVNSLFCHFLSIISVQFF